MKGTPERYNSIQINISHPVTPYLSLLWESMSVYNISIFYVEILLQESLDQLQILTFTTKQNNFDLPLLTRWNLKPKEKNI